MICKREGCTVEFEPNHLSVKYCSDACRKIVLRERNYRASKLKAKKPIKYAECDNCQKTFRSLRAGHKFCSKSCYYEYLSRIRKESYKTRAKISPIPECYLVRGNISYCGTGVPMTGAMI